MSRTSKYILGFFALISTLHNAFYDLHPDEAYYWDWSRHLSLSYLDHPPMIAYLIRIFTGIFGTHEWSIRLVNVCCLSLASYLIYHFAKQLFNTQTADTALVLWLCLPVNAHLFWFTSPDNPLILFWTAALYSYYLALQTKRIRYFYLTGLSIGFALLSKYPAILLLISLFLYTLLHRSYHYVFKNIHLYLSGLLSLLIFSPVLIWNAQHQWASFVFQWTHGVATKKTLSLNFAVGFLGGQLLIVTPVFFIGLFVLLFQHKKIITCNEKWNYLLIPFFVTLGFFGYQGLFAVSHPYWPTTAYISIIILFAYWIHTQSLKNFKMAIMATSLPMIFVIKFPQTLAFVLPTHHAQLNKILFEIPINRALGFKSIMQQASLFIKSQDLILTSHYFEAAEARFYLPNHPNVYILSGKKVSMYDKWSQSIRQTRHPQAWYIGNYQESLQPFFNHCTKITTLAYTGGFAQKNYGLYNCVQ